MLQLPKRLKYLLQAKDEDLSKQVTIDKPLLSLLSTILVSTC